MIFNLTQPLISSVPVLGKDFTWTGGDGTCVVVDDGGGNWRIKFLSSGVLTWLKDMLIDAFLVGAGGGGSLGGAGAGYTTTVKGISLIANTSYTITVGAGGSKGSQATNGKAGGSTSAFSVTANGGYAGGSFLSGGGSGGNGGSGGGNSGGTGGTDGSDGVKSSSSSGSAGKGQGTTTREFGEPTGDLYASGGSGISDGAEAGADNTGDGGDYMNAGGSGIVIIRKHKEAAA